MYQMYDTVTIVNRTSKTLTGTFDSRQKELFPGENKCTKIEALKYREQHPIMGIGTPLEEWDQKSQYLLGIVELGDDISPVEQSDALQRWDSYELNGGATLMIRGKGGMFNVRARLPRELVTDVVSGDPQA